MSFREYFKHKVRIVSTRGQSYTGYVTLYEDAKDNEGVDFIGIAPDNNNDPQTGIGFDKNEIKSIEIID